MKAAVAKKVSRGEVFIPFHFGYWDATDKRARAANELTTRTSTHICSAAKKSRYADIT